MALIPIKLTEHVAEIAVHESGHAAAYLIAGRSNAQIIELRLNGDDSGNCRVRYRQPNPNAILAGYVCELRLLEGKRWRPTPEELAANIHLQDIADAAAIVGVHGLSLLWEETALIVDHAWDRIQAIAGVLSVAGVLRGDEVEAIWADSERFQSQR